MLWTSDHELSSTEIFQQARQILLTHRTDYKAAREQSHWPEVATLNWAIDWFDHCARGHPRTALHIVRRGPDQNWREEKARYQELPERSSRIARHFQNLGMKRGDRLLVMIPNIMALWETCLAAMKLGVADHPDSHRSDRGRS